MGYMINDGLLRIVDSDTASDFAYGIEVKMIASLRKEMEVKENNCNTDGIINVALFIADAVIPGGFYREHGYDLKEFAKELLPKLEKYIKSAKNRRWDTESNKNEHVEAYQDIYDSIAEWVNKR